MSDGGLLDQDSLDEIRELLVGRRVVSVTSSEWEGTLTLDDGTVLTVIPNDGCGGCSSGNYSISEINECPDNVITDVELVDLFSDGRYDDAHTYSIYVLAFDKRVKLLEVEGDDGNGWYGTGYTIRVQRP
jgi:hypothetical protein